MQIGKLNAELTNWADSTVGRVATGAGEVIANRNRNELSQDLKRARNFSGTMQPGCTAARRQGPVNHNHSKGCL